MAHPEGDCEDCGVLHMPWSAHQREIERRLELSGEVLALEVRLTEALKGVALEVKRMALEELLDVCEDEQ